MSKKPEVEIAYCPHCERETPRAAIYTKLTTKVPWKLSQSSTDMWQVECRSCGMRGPRATVKLHAILDWNNISRSCA